ncbi:MAG: phosphatase PAP2 family protein [Desulfocapsaceae bacterium]|nr:phosphatase PAP2 family protein [Desulfocapsaceae bacterium]
MVWCQSLSVPKVPAQTGISTAPRIDSTCHSTPMQPNLEKKSSRRDLQQLLAILCSGLIALLILTPRDYSLTVYFSTHPSNCFANFMNRSLFNGAVLPGAGDFVYPLLLIAFLLYIPSCLWKFNGTGSKFHTLLAAYRPLFGFTLTSAFSCALLFTHTVKQIVGRARPDSVFQKQMAFSEWYQDGAHFFTGGAYTGSFPSGHTATASISIIFAYVLLAGLGKGGRHWLGRAGLICALAFTALMGIARMMSASHWLTDVVFTLFSQWALIHLVFFRLLKVPEQQEYFQQHHRPETRPLFFELRLCLLLLPLCPGLWAFFTGLRSLHFVGWSWLAALTPAGLVWSLFFLGQLRKALSFNIAES